MFKCDKILEIVKHLVKWMFLLVAVCLYLSYYAFIDFA